MTKMIDITAVRKLGVKDIITDYDKLSERCEEVDLTKKGSEVSDIIIRMKQVIREGNLTGLAANQLGYNKRIICINFDGDIRSFINPIVENAKGVELSEEHCSSLPERRFIRIRNTSITVTYQTPTANIKTVRLDGMAARVFQHELDHLEGILLSDIGFEIDDDWDNASDEERQEVIDYYIDSLDMNSEELSKDVEKDPEARQLSQAMKFMESVRTGKTKIEKIPLTEEELKVLDEYKKEQEEVKNNE